MKTTLNKGTTLIEIIIYVALFSIIITGAFVTSFQLMNSDTRTNQGIVVQEEGNFVVNKLNWAMTGLSPTIIPTVNGTGCNQILTTNKINYPFNPIVFRMNESKIEMSESGGAYTPITTANVKVTCFKAIIIPTNGQSPLGISATTTIDGVDFSTTKYNRK